MGGVNFEELEDEAVVEVSREHDAGGRVFVKVWQFGGETGCT